MYTCLNALMQTSINVFFHKITKTEIVISLSLAIFEKYNQMTFTISVCSNKTNFCLTNVLFWKVKLIKFYILSLSEPTMYYKFLFLESKVNDYNNDDTDNGRCNSQISALSSATGHLQYPSALVRSV